MTSSIPGLDTVPSSPQADINAASYYVLEPLRVGSEGTEVLAVDAVGDDDPEEQEPSFFGITLGFPDRPARRHAFRLDDISEATLVLDELRAANSDARIWVVDDLDDQGLEILGDNTLLGLIVAMADRGRARDAHEWKWLVEDAAGNRQPEGRDYSPFFASLAQLLAECQAYKVGRT